MMLAHRLARQLAHPSGLPGRLLGNAMDVVNRKPTRLAVDLLAPGEGEAVLDAGCGTGAAMAELLARTDCLVTGADASATMLEAARQRIGARASYLEARLEDLALPDATFDAVLALNVLYFEDSNHAMLHRMHRLLKTGGRIVAYVTDRQSMENWSFTREGFHRLFDRDALCAAFADAGFAQERIEVHEVAITRSVTGLLARAWRS
ncbi:class I SAM-dependent methyltransferase [Novosphingobium sp. PY1]|jgi:ubiquinone/menaquinone biosynthesis C-methylase UbiE|uniref:Type 11 methyltransferase n=1 Tax=Ochrobactrum sp. PW1 TaxID=1882222 RepID=A0A292GT81_9HYPH|nr:class I SAM-dependent methyltransferase [Novosphingobium sp. PY1]BBA74352.1 type 11 methyltransferase [Ochrobactrum sp. PW1]GFM29201.1 type 11 methyltransferase [Novosphingobium sp. PY1]